METCTWFFFWTLILFWSFNMWHFLSLKKYTLLDVRRSCCISMVFILSGLHIHTQTYVIWANNCVVKMIWQPSVLKWLLQSKLAFWKLIIIICILVIWQVHICSSIYWATFIAVFSYLQTKAFQLVLPQFSTLWPRANYLTSHSFCFSVFC